MSYPFKLPRRRVCASCGTNFTGAAWRCPFCGEHIHRPGTVCKGCGTYTETKSERRERERIEAEAEARAIFDEFFVNAGGVRQ